MAQKEATVFIIDLGKSMREKHGRKLSDLDFSLEYLYDKIGSIIGTGRKGMIVGVLGLRTDGTENDLADDGYDNISVLQPLEHMDVSSLRKLSKTFKPSNTNSGDALSAIILGVDMIMKVCKKLQYIKKLYLLTNGTGPLDADEADLESTAKQIQENNIKLTVLGVDFDDAEYGFKEEDKPFGKADNETALRKLVDLTEGTYATMVEAVEQNEIPFIKEIRPMPSYKGQLKIGGAEFDSTITIDIERYPRTKVRKPPSSSQHVIRTGPSQMDLDEDHNGLASVKVAHSYQVPDATSATGFKDISREDLADGYQYGRAAVSISESDKNVTILSTDQSYEIIGFVPLDSIERYMMMGETHMIVPSKLNDKAAFALSSLIHGLHISSSRAVARYVQKDMSPPKLVLLSPLVDDSIECLIENDLPFAEDLRPYRFPPLDKVYTVSGQVKKDHIKLPSDRLISAMSDYVDNMSLMNPDGSERFAIEDVYSPLVNSIEYSVKYRATHPDSELPEKLKLLTEPSRIPEDIKERSKPSLTKLIEVADVKKVPARVKGRAKWRQKESEKPLSNLDIDALLSLPKENNSNGTKRSVKIDPLNAIPEFKRLMQTVDDEEDVKSGVEQMAKIAQDLVKSSFGDVNYDQAIAVLGVVRDEMVDLEMPDMYNTLLTEMKERVVNEELSGDRWDFWYAIKSKRKLGFISREESDTSNLSREEAQKLMFLKS